MAKRPTYTKEFKDTAIAEALETSFAEAAKKRGINPAMLGRWSRELKNKGAPKSHKSQPKALGVEAMMEKKIEVEALMEKKIAELQEQIEVLRKAIELLKTI